MTTLPFQDAALSPEARTDDLLSRLTLEEKAGQLSQYFYFGTGELPDEATLAALPEEARDFALQPQKVEEALDRGDAGSLLFVVDPALHNRLQHKAIEGSRLGIPLIFGFDVIHGLRTIMPVPIAMAASWNPSTATDAQAVAAREARAVGVHWTFAPMVDIARDPRWGRIVEGAGEDPVLGAAVAAAQVRGFQGESGAPDRVISGPKHFAGYGAARGGRDYEDSDISDSELHNVYLKPFRAAVDAGAGNVMSAYMDLNGVPATGNRWLLTDILRDEFGFDGWVVSDANAVQSLATQHFAKDLTDAGARALNAGLDMEMCMFDPAYGRLPEAIAAGLVEEATLDQAVRRVLLAKFRLGLFEHPFVDEDATAGILSDGAHRDVSRAAAEKTLVLLKNDGGLLPLNGQKSVAVIGQLADSPRDTLGPWVFDHDVAETVTILGGIQARAGEGITVKYATGVRTGTRVFESMFDRMDHGLPTTPDDFDDDAELARAVELARESEVAVVVIGQNQNMIGEFASSSTLDLPGRQLELLQAVVETGTPTVALVMSGRPLDLRWADAHVPSILQVWYPGSRGGEAVAAALFGDVVPGGRLPFTWPRTVGQVPIIYNHYRTFQPENSDKRYWDEGSTPLYVFGHGLSYAEFGYGEVTLEPATIAVGASTTVSVDVTNRSGITADEVVQLYIHQRHGESTRPIRELKGFERVTLAGGETRRVTFDLGPDQLRYWSAASRGWVQDATEIDVWVGGSSSATNPDTSVVLTVEG
ncbi:MAG TPA: glycoside hydrolase family 3 N-terminal domain-containing protein [Propionicimonas sp.]|uniref:glycoside hydrolase family 3 N-terminal domain-containing protein n=1 Tax=Propionicimonas sp. TaxID=1955623 RepID=UPI002F40097D